MPSEIRTWAVLMVMGASATLNAVASISRDEALASAYPGATIRSEQVFLTAAQQQRSAELAGVAVQSRLVVRYIAQKDGALVGRAYVDTHIVRSKKETLLVSLDARGAIKRLDVTAFLEPAEYEPSDAWRDQYPGRTLASDLYLQRAIRPIAGATLTARAVNDSIRRVLAIDQVLENAK